jgi:hypothetical protein
MTEVQVDDVHSELIIILLYQEASWFDISMDKAEFMKLIELDDGLNCNLLDHLQWELYLAIAHHPFMECKVWLWNQHHVKPIILRFDLVFHSAFELTYFEMLYEAHLMPKQKLSCCILCCYALYEFIWSPEPYWLGHNDFGVIILALVDCAIVILEKGFPNLVNHHELFTFLRLKLLCFYNH